MMMTFSEPPSSLTRINNTNTYPSKRSLSRQDKTIILEQQCEDLCLFLQDRMEYLEEKLKKIEEKEAKKAEKNKKKKSHSKSCSKSKSKSRSKSGDRNPEKERKQEAKELKADKKKAQLRGELEAGKLLLLDLYESWLKLLVRGKTEHPQVRQIALRHNRLVESTPGNCTERREKVIELLEQ